MINGFQQTNLKTSWFYLAPVAPSLFPGSKHASMWLIVAVVQNHLKWTYGDLRIKKQTGHYLYFLDYIRHAAGKPLFGDSDQTWLKPVCSATETG